MDSPRPFQLAAVTMFLASIVVVWLYLRRRVGGWLALAGVLPVLVLGPAWDDLLFPFQISFFGSCHLWRRRAPGARSRGPLR